MTGPSTGTEEHPGMPRWLKLSLAVIVALVLVLIVVGLLGVGPQHGPGRH